MAVIDPTKKDEARKYFPEMPDGHFDAFFYLCNNFSKKEIAFILKKTERTITKLLKECCQILNVSDINSLRPALALRIHFCIA